MSFFTDSSLCFIPSGVKNGKAYSIVPTDGTGDLTFSRASNATRVNSSGLVERVRENVLLYSNDFSNANWGAVGTPTLTANYDTNPLTGANDAWRFQSASASDRIYQAYGVSFHNFSLYAKGTGTLRLRDSSGTYYFDLVLTSSWQRASVHIAASAGNVQITSTGGCDATIYGAQLETGDIATDPITTLGSAVSVGPVSGLPRLDYSGGASCCSLLLEPQRSNLFTFSEDITKTGSPHWIQYGGVTVTANNAISPDGYLNADKMNATGGVYTQKTFTASTAYAISVFIKKDTATHFRINYVDQSPPPSYLGGEITYNFATGAIVVTQSANSSVSAEAVDYGNGWIRLVMKMTANAAANYHYQQFDFDGGEGWVWGFQMEAGAYATSYIPTLSSAVTRVADSASKTGIASLIGQSEGTLFCDFNVLPSTLAGSYYLETLLSDGTANNKISMAYYGTGRIQFVTFVGGSLVVNINLSSYGLTVGKHKFALAYKLNDYVAYVDGVSVGTDTSAAVPAMSALNLYDTSGGTHAVNQALVFKTRLSNADLATLTTI